MNKLILSLLTIFFWSSTIAQSVVTYAGKPHDDYETYYESSSNLDLLSSYFSSPEGICIDSSGNMYISEKNKIRLINNNKVHIRAGSLQKPSFAEGYKNGTGTQTTFRNPCGMVCDSDGNVYVADVDNHCIRKIAKYVNLGNGQVVSTFAGANPTVGLPGYGTSGSTDGKTTAARFNKPMGIAMDIDGYFYVTDYDNMTIRKISPTGDVSTLSGKALSEGFSDGKSTDARFGAPWGVAIYNDNHIVVSDPWNTNIRKINIYSGETSTLAGPTNGSDSRQVDGTLSDARFKSPKGIAVVNGIVYVADQNTIRAIDEANNKVSTFAGNIDNFEIIDGSGKSASFTELSGLITDNLGNLYATENSQLINSHVIRKITINNLAPVADFKSSKTSLLVNELTTLTDLSSGQEVTSRTWEINPQTYEISQGDLSSKTLDIKFTVAGFYSITLNITNEYGTDSKVVKDYIAVSTTGNVTKLTNSDALIVYPNPVYDELFVDFNEYFVGNKAVLSLHTIDGHFIQNIEVSKRVSVSHLPNGVYLVLLKSDNTHIVKRIIIHHK